MKTLHDFTISDQEKFLYAQIVINLLKLHYFKYKIGGSFARFIVNDNVTNFHDVDIIVKDSELTNILFCIKEFINNNLISEIDYKYNYFRINCNNVISVNIISDINKVTEMNKTFMNMELVNS